MLRVSHDADVDALGSTVECLGTSSTSSNVSAVVESDGNLLGAQDIRTSFHSPLKNEKGSNRRCCP